MENKNFKKMTIRELENIIDRAEEEIAIKKRREAEIFLKGLLANI